MLSITNKDFGEIQARIEDHDASQDDARRLLEEVNLLAHELTATLNCLNRVVGAIVNSTGAINDAVEHVNMLTRKLR